MTSDEQIVERALAGDREAFGEIACRWERRIFALAFGMLGSAEEARDVTQETFLAAFRNIRGYRGGSFTSWLVRIATNRSYDQLRARRRRPSLSLSQIDHEADDGPREFIAPGIGPEDHVLCRELGGTLQRLVQGLAPDQRLAVVLSDIQGLSYDEIVGITGWPLGTVKSRLSRARAELRAELAGKDARLPSHDL